MDDEELLEPGEDGWPGLVAAAAAAAPASVVVRLAGERFALPAETLAEVARIPPLTRVPGVPGFVRGVANHRGRVLAVLDLRPLLGLPGTTATAGSGRLLVCGSDDVDFGLLVDGVEGLSVVGSGGLEPPLATLPSAVAALVEGSAVDESGPVTLLSAPALAALRDRLPFPVGAA